MKTFRVKVNGKEYEVEVEEIGATTNPLPAAPAISPASTPQTTRPVAASTPKAMAAAQDPTDGKITAPMPGTVLRLICSNGQTVKKGDTLLVLEAMKMENEIQAPADGKVEEFKVSEGQSVDAGDILVQLAI